MSVREEGLTTPPYNPWASYLVEASAGSGKTWQLSRRFLALVVAGADPSSILTVTFTRKAAAEMRERIIHDAVRLGEFDKEFSGFIEQVETWQRRSNARPTKIRDAAETAKLILEKTQTLKITTIDALFMQWVQQFPLETAISAEDGDSVTSLHSPWQLLSNLELQRLEQRAWTNVLSMAGDDKENRELMQSLSLHAPNGSIKQLSRAIAPIMHCDTFLWSVSLATGEDPARYHSVPAAIPNDQEFLMAHESLLKDCINLVTNADKRAKALGALATRDFEALIQCQIINSKKDSLSGTTFRSATAKDHPSYQALSEVLLAWDKDAKLSQLNHTAKLLWSLFHARARVVHRLKANESVGTFADAVKGVSLMATEASAIGARAMAWGNIRHLMLDEFQDTSKLQWMIFERLARELLSGSPEDVSPPASVFIVGDKKQSIYRFREADPSMMEAAKSSLSPLGLNAIRMSESYRSSSAILDMVNAVFEDETMIPEFPEHRVAAAKLKSASSKSAYGTISVYAEAKSEDQQSSITDTFEIQAKQIADHILHATNGTLGIKVFDEEQKQWRNPRFSDFVVLYPKKTHAHLIEDALRAHAIPCQKEERHGFFERPEIVDMRAFVTWLTWPADTIALCTILRSPLCQLSDRDLQELLLDGADLLMPRLKAAHPDLYKLLAEMRSAHERDNMSKIIGHLLTDYQIADRYEQEFGTIEGPLARANILKWFDMIRSRSADDALDAQSWTLAMDEASEEDETGNASLAANAVSLMTIHKSKGLEFPCVVVSDLASDWHRAETGWLRDSRPGREGLWYIGPSNARPRGSQDFNDLLAINEQESRDEKARLLYVALTRASTHLVLTGASPKKPVENSYHAKVAVAAATLSDVTKLVLPTGATMYSRGGPISDSAPINEISKRTDLPNRTQPKSSLTGRPSLLILTPSSGKLTKQTDDGEHAAHDLLAQQTFSSEVGKAYGTIVHKLIENHVTKVTWSDRRLLRLVSPQLLRVQNISSDDFLALAKKDVSDLLESTLWQELTKNAAEILCEVPLAGIEGSNLLNAKADLIIIRKDQSMLVLDFKTIELASNALEDSKLKALCQDLGYTEQVRQYCKLAAQAFKIARAEGAILFTKHKRLLSLN